MLYLALNSAYATRMQIMKAPIMLACVLLGCLRSPALFMARGTGGGVECPRGPSMEQTPLLIHFLLISSHLSGPEPRATAAHISTA